MRDDENGNSFVALALKNNYYGTILSLTPFLHKLVMHEPFHHSSPVELRSGAPYIVSKQLPLLTFISPSFATRTGGFPAQLVHEGLHYNSNN